MARAIAKCTCEKCGAEFEKMKHNLRNRTEANSWKEWAEWHYTTCEDCTKKEKAEKQAKEAEENGLELMTIKYYIYKKVCPTCLQVKDSYNEEEKTVDIYVDEESKKAIQAFIEEESKLEIVEVSYSEYKNNYANCKQVSGSYNRSTKTIQIYVTRELKNQILGIEEEIPEEPATPSEEDNTSSDDNNTNTNENMEENEMNNEITYELLLKVKERIEKRYEMAKADYEKEWNVFTNGHKSKNLCYHDDEILENAKSYLDKIKYYIQLVEDRFGTNSKFTNKTLDEFKEYVEKLYEEKLSKNKDGIVNMEYHVGQNAKAFIDFLYESEDIQLLLGQYFIENKEDIIESFDTIRANILNDEHARYSLYFCLSTKKMHVLDDNNATEKEILKGTWIHLGCLNSYYYFLFSDPVECGYYKWETKITGETLYNECFENILRE